MGALACHRGKHAQRVRQQGKRLGRPKVAAKVEDAIRTHLRAAHGILKVARMVGCGSGTVQRVKREMADRTQAIG
jgi:DNA invertase Pin-like site-specific DNA recombinase